jgi:hypothetical protein
MRPKYDHGLSFNPASAPTASRGDGSIVSLGDGFGNVFTGLARKKSATRGFEIQGENLTLSELAYKLGTRLSRVRFIRNAIEEQTDLREFRKPPTLRIFVGIGLICLSFAMCWPVIGFLTGVSVYYHRPYIAAIGAPIIYVSSHLVYIAGMTLSGEKYVRIFFKWLSRLAVEKMLASEPKKEIPADVPDAAE